MKSILLAILSLTVAAAPLLSLGQAATDPSIEPAQRQPAAELTVAVLNFEAADAGGERTGEQIAAALAALLSGEDGLRMVDRAEMSQILQEQELTLSGLVDTREAVRIGQLVGARLILTGKAFPLGQQLFVTAKLIGTETSLVEAVLVKGAPSELDNLVAELAMKLAERIRESGPKLVAQPEGGEDPLVALRAKLAGRELPVVAVVVPEEHLGQAPATPQAPDPAVETELKLLMRACGIKVIDTPHNDLIDWARSQGDGTLEPWPRSLAGADLVIAGEAFSEYAGRMGNLIGAAARAELNVIDRKTGEIIVADRTTTRSVDLAETIAGRKALQQAGRQLGLRLLEELADRLPEKQDAAAEAE